MAYWIEELRRLASLHEQGILSDEEFEELKRGLLPNVSGEPEVEVAKTGVDSEVEELRRLSSLHDRGILSDSEFASMKTRILGHSTISKEALFADDPPVKDPSLTFVAKAVIGILVLALIGGLLGVFVFFGGEDTGNEGAVAELSSESPKTPSGNAINPKPCSNSPYSLNIGTLLPETGPLAFLSAPMLEGVNMAIRDINAAGGVNCADVTLRPGDSGTNAEIANATVDRLLTEDVDAIIGAASSGTTGSVINKITKTNGITQCSPSNTAAGLGVSNDSDNGNYFRTAPSDDLQAQLLANVVLGDGYTNVAVVSRADDYGVSFNAVLIPAIQAGGGTVVYRTPYAPEARSFNDVVQNVVASGPDAVVLVAFEEGFQIIQAMIEQGAGPDAIQIYITDGMATEQLGAAIDPDNPGIAEGMKGTAPAAAPDSGAAFFPDAFAEYAPGVPSIYSSQSYDCAILIALAAEAAGSNDSADISAAMVDVSRDGEKCSTFADCKDLLAGGTNIDYDGASGAIDFLDAGEPGAGIYDIYDFDENGVQRVLEQQTFIQ